MAQTATYKGKTYNVAFIGQTKFGRRAKLAFLDGSKEFWVDAAQISAAAPVKSRAKSLKSTTSTGYWQCGCGEENEGSRRSCWECGSSR